MRAPRNLATLLLATLLSASLWYALGREQQIPGALASGQRIQCASWTPFQGAETPMSFRLDPARVERDFALLSQRFRCVRIYSMKDMESVPELARRHGLGLIAGAWVNADDADTEREIAALIAMARRYPDVVGTVLVGNEVLLRRERTVEELAAYVRRVRAAVGQPVGYADVWEFWLHNRSLGAAVDVVAIHLLPYWENRPTGIEDAIDAVARAHARVAKAFPGKEVLVGETGWPSEGRRRQDAQPGRVNEARFVRGLVARAQEEGWRYNLIEAFDQPWKRAQEGAVGGYWGLYDGARHDKNVLAGPVSDLPGWRYFLLLAMGAWSLLALSVPRRDSLTLLVQAAAANGVALHVYRMLVQARDVGEYVHYLLVGSVALACTWLWARRRGGAGSPRWGDALQLLLLALLGIETLCLAFDPRYRDFPLAVFATPAILLAHDGLGRTLARARGRALAIALLACIPAIAWQETVYNPVAMGWIALLAVVGVGLLRSRRERAGA